MKMLEEDANIRRRKITGKATVIFLGVMVLLTFFSNTINNFSLPKVTLEKPANGSLIKEITGNGKVEAKNIYDAYISSSMKVTDVLASVGDTVSKGQTLLTLDIGDLENQLRDEQDRCAQKKLALEKLIAAGEKLRDSNSPQNLMTLDRSVGMALQKAEKAQKEHDANQALYEAGGISGNALEESRQNLENAQLDYEIAKNARDKEISNIARDIENNERDIKSTRLDIEIAERKISELAEELKMGVVAAPCDGIITELYYSKGMTANASQPLYKIADVSGGFEFVVTVDISAAEYLKTGDEAQVTISSSNGSIKGTIRQIRDNQQQIGAKKDIEIDIPPDGLIGGETGTVEIKNDMGSYNTLVSNGAIGQDNDGYFVYVLKERKGPLGNEFYVERVSVTVGDEDNTVSAVLNGLTSADRVVSSSDKPLSNNSRVMPAE